MQLFTLTTALTLGYYAPMLVLKDSLVAGGHFEVVEFLSVHDVPLSLVGKQESGGLWELATIHLVLALVIAGLAGGGRKFRSYLLLP